MPRHTRTQRRHRFSRFRRAGSGRNRASIHSPLQLRKTATAKPTATAATRARNMKEGIVVDEQIWQQIQDLAAGKTDVKDIASACILDQMNEESK